MHGQTFVSLSSFCYHTGLLDRRRNNEPEETFLNISVHLMDTGHAMDGSLCIGGGVGSETQPYRHSAAISLISFTPYERFVHLA